MPCPRYAERLAEEQRLADIAEKEHQDILRLEREEAERVRKVEEARLAAELEARLLVEDKENAPQYAEQEQILEREQQNALALAEWNRCAPPARLPAPARRLSLWRLAGTWRATPFPSSRISGR